MTRQNRPTVPQDAPAQPPVEVPAEGGSYTRNPDGTLTRDPIPAPKEA